MPKKEVASELELGSVVMNGTPGSQRDVGSRLTLPTSPGCCGHHEESMDTCNVFV